MFQTNLENESGDQAGAFFGGKNRSKKSRANLTLMREYPV
jgi:hypothetical protein